MYNVLFNAITETQKFLSDGDITTAKWLLEEAQREAENIFMEWNWEDGGEPEDGSKNGPAPS